MIACTLGLFGTVNAQETITMGTRTQDNYSLPIEVYWSYSFSQQSYSKTEIAEAGGYAGTITSLAFKTMDDEYSAGSRNLKVFLTNIDTENETTFAIANPYYNLSDLSGLVYEGTVNFVGSSWNTIEFQTPFVYNGNHLLVTVLDNTGSNQNDIYFEVHQKSAYDENGNAISWATNTGNHDGALDPTAMSQSTPNGVRNNIQLTFAAAGEGGEEPTPEPEPTPTIPSHPASMTATANGQNSITLTWEAVEGATSYNVYSQAAGHAMGVTATEYTYENLEAGTEYCFEVTAENAAGESYDAAYACATTEAAPVEPEPVAPAAPANVVATANGQNSIVVTWDAVEGATDYYVYKDGQMWANTSGATTYTENGLSAGTEYCFAVQTVAGDLESELSETKCATTEAEVEEPTEPEQPGGEYASSFAFDFENAALDGWRVFQGSGASSNNWKIGSGSYYGGQGDGYGVYSLSYGTSSLVARNYIVTTEPYAITSGSVLSWWIKHTYQGYEIYDPYAVVISTDGENFEQIAEYTPGTGVTEQLSLAEYAGQNLYIGFYHYGQGGDAIVLDNITLIAGEGGEEPETPVDPEPEQPVAPAAPVVAATATETTITLTWEAVENATSYNIYTPSSFSSNVFGLTETTYTFENLTAGEYCFQVSAVNDVDESDATEVCATIEAPVVEEPEGEMCVIDITLEDSYGDGWNGNVLKVEYGTTTKEFTLSNGKTATETMEIPSGSHVTATFICTSAYGYPQENGFTIAYESGEVIVSVDKNTYAMNTPVTQAYEFDLDCTPKAPATPVVKAVATGGSTIALTITSAGAESYNIYNGTETVATGVTENPYTVEGLTAATEYCFTVVAVNGVGNSEASEAACATTFAEGTTIVAVGDGDIAQMSAPIYNAGPGAVYSLSQQIYTAEEIGLEGNVNIYSISFHHATGNNNARDIVVYLTNVEKELYEGNYDWAAFSEEDMVYQGVYNFGKAEDWVTIEFQNAFEYTGGNIAVTVYDKTGSGYGYTYDICDKFYSYQVNEWRGMYVTKTAEMDFSALGTYYATSMNTGSWGSPANAYYINNVKFRALAAEGGEEPTPEPVAPAAPANVVATANGMNSIVLTWDAVEGATDYYVYKDGQMWANTNGATTYTENGLTMGTEYCFAVQTVAGDLESELSEQVCATTESLPENQILVGTATTSYYAPFFTILSSSERWFEAIYKADEIGKAGRIGEIAFSYNQGSETAADIKIYLAEVTKSVFESPADLTPATDLTLVYTGTNVTLCDSAWETFVLDTPFNYGGEKNLLLVVVTTNTSLSNKWNCYTDANTALIKDAMLDNKKPVMMLTLVEGGNEEPTPVAKDYRLESVETSYSATAYVYDEELTNKVVAIDEEGLVTVVSYNEEGQILEAVASYEDVDEEGNPIETVLSSVEYAYDENGVWVGYTEFAQGWFGPITNETVFTYNAEGRLVSLASDASGLVQELSYNEAGLLSQVLEGYMMGDEEEDEEEIIEPDGVEPLSETEVAYESKITFEYDTEGRLVKKNYYYYDMYETMEFYLAESEVYEYDENGNCATKKVYLAETEDEEGNLTLNSFPYNVVEYFYDLTINNEDVYSFEYPHFAFINWVEPSYVNILTKELSYYSYYDYDLGEVVSHSYEATVYNYNPEVLSAPFAPMNLSAEVLSAESVELTWAGFADAESFTIYSADTVYAEGLVDPYYTIEGLEIGVEYCFEVVAVNTVGTSETSNTACVTIELPAAPANLVAEATSETEIALTWDEVPGIYSYNVYQVVEVEGETTYELLGEAWWTEYTVTELTAATQYSFVVKAVNNVGESEASNVATATTLAPPAPTVPAAPVVTGSFEGDIIILEWEAVEGALAYNLYYGGKLLAGPFEETIAEIQVPSVGTYCFTVTAVNEVGESEHSDEVCVTVTAPEDMEAPAAPVLEATLDGNKAILTWEEVEGATYYDVYIEVAPGQGQYLGTATMEDLPISLELPEHGIYCFYVVAVNLVGESEPSNVACVNYGNVGVEENEASFNIYPNPVSDRLVIETEANIEAVTIYTVTGVVVYSEVDYNNNTIDVSDFANGVYIMKVRTENGEAVQRFIKK